MPGKKKVDKPNYSRDPRWRFTGPVTAYRWRGNVQNYKGGLKPKSHWTGQRLPYKFLRLKTDEETQAGLKGLVEFFEYSDTKYGKGRIAFERKRWVDHGSTPGELGLFGFAFGAKNLERTRAGEEVWSMSKNAAGRTEFRHKHIPGWTQEDVPHDAFDDITRVAKDIRDMVDGKRNEVKIPMMRIRRDEEMLPYVLELLPRDRHWDVSTGNNAQYGDPEMTHYTLNDNSRPNIAAALRRDAYQEELENNSSAAVLNVWKKFDYVTISEKRKRAKGKGYATHEGAFFDHILRANVADDEFAELFRPYGIFNKVDHRNYLRKDGKNEVRVNCIVETLEAAGVDASAVRRLHNVCRNDHIEQKQLEKVAAAVHVNIKLIHVGEKLRVDGTTSVNRFQYPKAPNAEWPTVQAVLMNSHYFHNGLMPITQYALKHYDEVKHQEKWWQLYSVKGRKNNLKRIDPNDPARAKWADSKYVMEHLWTKHRDQWFEPMALCDELYKTTQYARSEFAFPDTGLADSPTQPCDSPEDIVLKQTKQNDDAIKKFGAPWVKVFFDYETFENKKNFQQEYLVSCCFERTEKEIAEGVAPEKETFHNGRQMLDWIYRRCLEKYGPVSASRSQKKYTGHPIKMYAHNSTFDFKFLCQHLRHEDTMERDGALVYSNADAYGYGFNSKFRVMVRNTYRLIPCKLDAMPKMLGFADECQKEVMPYRMYTQDTLSRKWLPLSECEAACTREKKDFTVFRANCVKWDILRQGTHGLECDIWNYSARYCEMDCIVLERAYSEWRKLMGEVCTYTLPSGETGRLDLDRYNTIQGMCDDYSTVRGCVEGVSMLSGLTRAWVQGAYVGGRTMLRDNQPQKSEPGEEQDDFDAVSCYPSAMARMHGYLIGDPEDLEVTTQEATKAFLGGASGYFVEIEIIKVGVCRGFPVLSVMDGGRQWTNDLVGKRLVVDRYTLEDAVEFQRIEYNVVKGVYFDQGFNSTVNTVMTEIFTRRLEAKNAGNDGLAEALKLFMNSCYGRHGLKPSEVKVTYRTAKEMDVFHERNYQQIISHTVTKDAKGDVLGARFRLVESVDTHFNRCHVASMVCSMAKRLMNEVICLAEDEGLDIFQSDTDSMHITRSHVPKLAAAFEQKYERELCGEALGQFNCDFAIKRNGKKVGKDVYATNSIVLAKKMYIDVLTGTHKETGETLSDYHVRMKGVPGDAIFALAENLDKTPLELYEYMYAGGMCEFNLVSAPSNKCEKVKFRYSNDRRIKTLHKSSMFSRKLWPCKPAAYASASKAEQEVMYKEACEARWRMR